MSQWMGHSDVNPTVKRYGRFTAEAKEQVAWINALSRVSWRRRGSLGLN